MTKTKLLSILLALVLCISTLCTALTSCANDPEDGNDASDDDTATPTPDDDEDKTEEDFDIRKALEALPECKFSGDEFLIAASSTYENRFVIEQFTSDDHKDGSLVHDALFDRDAMVEEVLGITIAYDDMLDSAMYGKIGNNIKSGDDTYSLVLGILSATALPMFNNNLLYDINEVPHVDLTKPWWNKNSIDNFQINNKIYMATGALTNRYVYAPYAMLFNQQLLADASLESPYELMDNNEWTLEKFAEMIEGHYYDLNPNDKVDIGDFFGLAPASDSETAYYFAAGASLLSKDKDNELVFTYMDDNNLDILDDVIMLYDSDDVLKYIDTYDSIAAFREGRAIFHSMALCDITMLNDMTDEYGIVPMPKYDEDQTEYYSNANRYISTMVLFPSSIADIDSVGLIAEALAMTSKYTSLDAQYEQVLLNRQALDGQSKASLMAVVESTSYDLCYALDFGGIVGPLSSLIFKGGAYASFYETYIGKLDSALDAFLEHYE